jgi:hypothetical protein
MTHDAGFSEAARVEAELRRIDEADRDTQKIGPNELVDVMRGVDVALLVRLRAWVSACCACTCV